MKLKLINGIPHWAGGGLTLPIMAGGDGSATPTPNPDDPFGLGAGGTGTSGGGAATPDGNIIGDKILMGGGAGGAGNVYIVKKSPTGMLYFENIATGGKAPFGPGMYVTPDGRQLNVSANGDYKKLGELNQDQTVNFLTTGEPYNIDPTALAGSGGAGSGSDHYSADMQALLQKYQMLKEAWAQEIENVNSGVTLEAGRAGFEADWAKLMNDFNTTQATLQQNVDLAKAQLEDTAKGRNIEDVRNREVEEALRRTRVAEEAGRRAKTITGDVLPRFVTGNNPINVPFLGPTRGTNVNFGELFNQGGAGNLNTLPAIAPQFAGGYGATQVAPPPQLAALPPMPTYPGAPQYPAMPGALLSWLGI